MKKFISVVAGNILLLVALFAAFEGILYLLFLYPFHSSILVAAREYHIAHARQNPMYIPACAEHDSSIAYRLKGPECTFNGREFSTHIRGNSLGVRDDERSLEAPEIVVLGDSQAFGWGVEQEAAFPAVLERETGKSVANLSLPSLGTVRELRLLKRTNLDKVTDIVLQYSDNDSEENRAFAGNGNKLLTMRQNVYEDHVRRSGTEALAYFPGKLTRYFLPPLARRVGGAMKGQEQKFRTPRNLQAEARQLLHVLRYSPIPLRNYRFWVLEVPSFGDHAPEFLATLQAEWQALPAEQQQDIGKLRTIELASSLGPGEFFVYDDHLNEKGHTVVAGLIKKALESED